MARRVSSPELIGRERELESLAAAFERVVQGRSAAVLVGGEAGVGKTRLAAEAQRRVLGQGARVLSGDCIELAEGELPFAPITAALRPVARDLGADEIRRLPAQEELARLLPELGGAPEVQSGQVPGPGGPLAQARLFEGLLALLVRLAEPAPVVLVLEDLHWADRSTRDFVGFLVRNAGGARLLLVCTFRSDELHRRGPLRSFLAELDRRPGVERLELAPLTRAEIGGLAGAVLGSAPSESFVGELFERCDGNPFLAEELLAASAGDGRLAQTLRDALMVRVDALPGHARAVLRAAAAAGRRVSHRLLERVSRLPVDDLDDALREAIDARILVQDGHAYAFRHALVREAISSDTLPGERTQLHAGLAEALADDPTLGDGLTGTGAAEVAHHWWEAGRFPEALGCSLAAAREAESMFAFAEAHSHLERALDLWDRVAGAETEAGRDRASVLAQAAENASRTPDPARAAKLTRRALDLVDRVEDPVRSAILHERLGRYLWLDGDVAGAMPCYQAAVDLMPDEPMTAELARILAAQGQFLMLRGYARESRSYCERAIAVARRVGARAEECHALNTLGVDLAILGDRGRGIELLSESKAVAEALDWTGALGRAYVNLSEITDWDGRTAESVALALEGAEAMRRVGARSELVHLENEAIQRLLRLGRLADAAHLLARIRETRATGFTEALQHVAAAELACIRGDVPAAQAAAREARRGLGPTRDSMYFGPTAACEVEVALAAGRPEEAIAAFEQALELLGGEEYAFSVARLYARGVRAYADRADRARGRADPDRLARLTSAARAAVQRFDALLAPERYTDGGPPPATLAHRAVVEAELTRLAGRSDPDLWARVADLWDGLGEPLEHVYAQWRRAEARLLGEAGRSEAARVLPAAAEAARELGARGLLGEIEDLARRARIPLVASGPEAAGDVPVPPVEAPLGLTGRELEVLALLAEGRTNREIGEALFMAPKTASVHVSRILAKLDVPSRVAAATKAYQLGIVRPATTSRPA